MTADVKQQAQRGEEAIRSGLDVMLTDAVAGTPPLLRSRAGGQGRGRPRPPSPRRRPRAAGLTTELARAATGRSQLAPAGGDRRFADPAWQENWLLRDLLQAYLALGETVDGLIDDADVDWRTERQARLAAGNVHRRAGADQLPVVKPGRAAGDRQHRRSQPGQGAAPARPRPVHAAAAAGDRRHEPLRGRAATWPSARARSCCVTRCSS